MNNSLAIWLCKNRWINRYVKRWNNSLGWITVKEGQKIYLDTQDISGPSFQTVRRGFEVYESDNRKLINKLLVDGGVFLDIGANIGHFSISVVNEKRNATVHAFEPFPKLAECLERTINENNLSINLQRVALSNTSSEAILYINDINLGNNSLQRSEIHEESKGRLQIKVQVEPLDKYLQLDRLDVMKIDVEGNEYETLQGAIESVAMYKPAMLIECRNELLETERSILRILGGMDYMIYVPELKELHSFESVKQLAKSSFERGLTHTDYAFLQPTHKEMLDL